MASIKLPYFGIINCDLLEEYYDAEVEYNGEDIRIDLNFENKSINPDKLEVVKHFIDNIRIHDLNNKRHLKNDFENKSNSAVRKYINLLLEVLPLDDIEDLTGANIKSAERPLKLLNNLHLIRVGIYPESMDFAEFDYSINNDFTNHSIVINTDENGNLDSITMEN